MKIIILVEEKNRFSPSILQSWLDKKVFFLVKTTTADTLTTHFHFSHNIFEQIFITIPQFSIYYIQKLIIKKLFTTHQKNIVLTVQMVFLELLHFPFSQTPFILEAVIKIWKIFSFKERRKTVLKNFLYCNTFLLLCAGWYNISIQNFSFVFFAKKLRWRKIFSVTGCCVHSVNFVLYSRKKKFFCVLKVGFWI